MMLDDLKAGDQVAMIANLGIYAIRSVTKVTPTQIVVGRDRFYKKGGREIGGGSAHIEPLMPEHKAEFDRKEKAKQDSQAASQEAGRQRDADRLKLIKDTLVEIAMSDGEQQIEIMKNFVSKYEFI